MKSLVILILALGLSVAGNTCPLSSDVSERLVYGISDPEQEERVQEAFAFEEVASVSFGTAKQEVLSRFGEPTFKIPSVRSYEGEIWAYPSSSSGYAFAFTFNDNDEVTGRRFDFESSDTFGSWKELIGECPGLVRFKCGDYDFNQRTSYPTFLYDSDTGATLPYGSSPEAIIWRNSDIGQLNSRDIKDGCYIDLSRSN